MTVWVVPAFDVHEGRHAVFSLGREYAAVNEFAFMGCEKALAIVMSNQSPTELMNGATRISRQRLPKAYDVYWLP